VTRETDRLLVEHLGQLTHPAAWQRMRDYTDNRDAGTPDALWVCEHPPVFTLGQAGRAEHVHDVGDIPLVPTDRGGQVTYHGPGQIIVYTLIDLRRRGIGIRDLVSLLENAVIDLLARHDVVAVARSDAPGVYVDGAKIAALGLRVRRGCSYHGLALNGDIDLTPFARIDPCGYRNMAVTRTQDLGIHTDTAQLAQQLVNNIRSALPATRQAKVEDTDRLQR
jgi:lipoyl(octanoyl) transferase